VSGAGWVFGEPWITARLAFAGAFYGLTLLMTDDLRWAPLEFGGLWAAALGTIGFRLRRLADQGA
jgi:hypothetical protein